MTDFSLRRRTICRLLIATVDLVCFISFPCYPWNCLPNARRASAAWWNCWCWRLTSVRFTPHWTHHKCNLKTFLFLPLQKVSFMCVNSFRMPSCSVHTSWCRSFFFCLNVIWSDCRLFLSPISPLRSHFQLAGGVVLAVGIWTLIEKSDYISLLSSKTYVASTYILVLAGAVVMVTGVLGCCATFKEHRKLLRVVSDCDTRRQDQSKQWRINQLLKKKYSQLRP